MVREDAKIAVGCSYQSCQYIPDLRFRQLVECAGIADAFDMKLRGKLERVTDMKMSLQGVQQFLILGNFSFYCSWFDIQRFPYARPVIFHQGKNQIAAICLRAIQLPVQTPEVVLDKLVAIHSFSWLECPERIQPVQGVLNLTSEFLADIFSPRGLCALVATAIQRYYVQEVHIIMAQ